MQTKQTAYDRAESADVAFQSALEQHYGERAGDMRYRTSQLPPDIKALALAYQDAVEVWRNAGKQ